LHSTNDTNDASKLKDPVSIQYALYIYIRFSSSDNYSILMAQE